MSMKLAPELTAVIAEAVVALVVVAVVVVAVDMVVAVVAVVAVVGTKNLVLSKNWIHVTAHSTIINYSN